MSARLILVGEGTLKNSIEEEIAELSLSGKVILTEGRSDVNDLLQAMDLFLFPSLYEGLGLALVEAQSAGLPCLISDMVPEESILTDLVRQLPLEEDPDVWAQDAVRLCKMKRSNRYDEIRRAGYDIRENAEKLQRLYLKMEKYSKV